MKNKEEKVLVVERAILEPFIADKPKNVLIDSAVLQDMWRLINEKAFFMDRWNGLEDDPTYKQIIPYMLLNNERKLFLLKRLNTQGESRLHNKLSIGVGGHINPCDALPGMSLVESGMYRELEEEVKVTHKGLPELLGIINDDTSEVSKVHLGMLFLISVDKNVKVKETDKMEGDWADMLDMRRSYKYLESWSKLAFDLINKQWK